MVDPLRRISRRTLLKTGTAAAVLAGSGTTAPVAAEPIAKPWSDILRQAVATASVSPRTRQLMDRGWRFSLGNSCLAVKDFNFGVGVKTEPYGKTGYFAEPCAKDFNVSGWQLVDLPHDWAVSLRFVDDPMLVRNGFKAIGRNYPENSIGWYRRVFHVAKEDAGKRFLVEFDGVFRDCVVVINGCFLGRNLSGYAPFHFDITDLLKPGEDNVLCLRVDASLQEGWFYEGAGVYRHVWLHSFLPVHFGFHGTYMRSEQRGAGADVFVTTKLENQSMDDATCTVHARIVDMDGKEIANTSAPSSNVAPMDHGDFALQLHVDHASLWSPDTPYLYRLEMHLERNGDMVDTDAQTFGIRYAVFDANRGLLLNGAPYKLKGTCNHQDHAGVGVAQPDSVQEFRIRKLKEMGSNSIRTSHNPASRAFIEACDRLGMLVMEENRMYSSCPEGLSQFERMIKRDRNSPSVLIWSMGNEEMNVQGNQTGVRIAKSMKQLARRLDPSRPVTAAMNGGWGPKGESPVLDVMGCNYHTADIDGYHREFPNQPMVGTETASTTGTRGIYHTDVEEGYVAAYDLVNGPAWAATAEGWWKFYDERPWLSGGFCWTGFDYRGEPTPYAWPCISSQFGIIDTCGFPKDNFFYYRAWWQNEPVVHLLPHWNWEGQAGKDVAVWCYSNLPEVELFLNGRSLGVKYVEKNGHLEWKVPFETGKLEARGMRDGKVVLTDQRVTSLAPTSIHASADRTEIRADGDDVAMVAVQLTDGNGTIVPWGNAVVEFTVSGPGRLIGVGNGDPSCHESDKGTQRSIFSGLCMAIVQATDEPGEIVVAARAGGLGTSQVRVKTVATPLKPMVPSPERPAS